MFVMRGHESIPSELERNEVGAARNEVGDPCVEIASRSLPGFRRIYVIKDTRIRGMCGNIESAGLTESDATTSASSTSYFRT